MKCLGGHQEKGRGRVGNWRILLSLRKCTVGLDKFRKLGNGKWVTGTNPLSIVKKPMKRNRS